MKSEPITRSAVAVVVFALLLLARGGQAAAAADPIAVRGSVSNLEAHKPVAGAGVTIEDGAGTMIQTMTDARGRYNAIGLSFGLIHVVVQRAGYEPAGERCAVGSGDTLRLDIGLVTHLTHIGVRHFPCVIEPTTSDLYRL